MGTMRSILMSRSLPTSSVKTARGFTLAEVMVAMAITVFLTAVVYGLLTRAQSSFYDSEAKIKLRNELRQATQKMEMEIRQSGYDQTPTAQFVIQDNTGTGGSDIIRFSVPVICQTNGVLLDANGNPAHWGAYIKWGCTTSSCADADDTCATLEYKYIQYSLNGSGQIVRTTLSPALSTVSTQILAEDITGFQITLAGTRMLTLTINGQRVSATSRVITAVATQTIRLMN
jgi:prepilin-type N-terminal cleavage/methylation domain-containing protein